MKTFPTLWADPVTHLMRTTPDHPVLFLCPRTLQETARMFQDRFDGLVTYAVKANDRPEVLANLVAAGIRSFDVASPAEMVTVRSVCPDAVLHYNNPVRSHAEIAQGIAQNAVSWSVDDAGELDKLDPVPRDAEVAVRFALPVAGAAYSFGDKFGATPQGAARLLRKVADKGWNPALSFHPGTQCADPRAWTQYMREAARIAERAGVRIARLNVGGGFASNRCGTDPDLAAVFQAIGQARNDVFGATATDLLCEPGRAMVAEAFTLAARVKAVRGDGLHVFLNDGIYGGLAEMRDMPMRRPVRVIADDGTERTSTRQPRIVFGPTCDSIDRLPGELLLPNNVALGDYVLFDGLGAYSVALSTGFNGYGLRDVVTVDRLTA